jgi:hypothetical protein
MARQVSIISFNRSSVDDSSPVLHEFDVKEELVAKPALEFGELLPYAKRIEAALQVCVTIIGTYCPKRRVVPRVVGEQRAGFEAGMRSRESDGTAGLRRH